MGRTVQSTVKLLSCLPLTASLFLSRKRFPVLGIKKKKEKKREKLRK